MVFSAEQYEKRILEQEGLAWYSPAGSDTRTRRDLDTRRSLWNPTIYTKLHSETSCMCVAVAAACLVHG